jgi:hypothetical protein
MVIVPIQPSIGSFVTVSGFELAFTCSTLPLNGNVFFPLGCA